MLRTLRRDIRYLRSPPGSSCGSIHEPLCACLMLSGSIPGGRFGFFLLFSCSWAGEREAFEEVGGGLV